MLGRTKRSRPVKDSGVTPMIVNNDPVEAQAAADRGMVASVILLPEVVADNRDGLGGLQWLRQAETRGRLKASRRAT